MAESESAEPFEADRGTMKRAVHFGCDARTALLAAMAAHAAREGKTAHEWADGLRLFLSHVAWVVEGLERAEEELRRKELWPWT